MPSAAFLNAAKQANRQPVVLMAVESLDAIRRQVATGEDWADGKSIDTEVNVTSVPGQVTLEHGLPLAKDAPWDDNPGRWGTISAAMPFDGVAWRLGPCTVRWNYTPGILVAVAPTLQIRATTRTGTLLGSVAIPIESARVVQNAYQVSFESLALPELAVTAGDVLCFTLADNLGSYGEVEIHTLTFFCGRLDVVADAGATRTLTLDLGVAPSVDSVVGLDYSAPYPSSVTVTARGSANGTDWTELGAVTDGSALDPYRYYDFLATLDSSGGTRGLVLREISVVGGDSQYSYFGTHLDKPLVGTRPYLKENGVSALASKIEVEKVATTGELSVRLHWTRETGDLIATGFLKNKAVLVKMGFAGLPAPDFEPFFAGVWHDYEADPVSKTITVKLRDVLKKFEKVKVPAADFDPVTAAKTTVPLVFEDDNILQVMLDIIDETSIPGRWVDTAAFTALRDGARSGTDWQVTRTLSEPEDFRTLLAELATLAGVFVHPLPDGRLSVTLFDPEATPAAVLDASELIPSSIQGGQEQLHTKQVLYYDPLEATPGDNPEDYAKGYLLLNSTAIAAWGETGQKDFYDKWGASAAAIEALAIRRDAMDANPKLKTAIKQIPPRYMGLRPGQVVQVDQLQLPCPAAEWPGITDGRVFLITSKKVDPLKALIDIELTEI